jgi:transposase
MRDTSLYQYLLGLESPWAVSEVKLDVENQRVDVWVEHPKGIKWFCPECGAEGPLHDHAEERVWRHLDSCQFQTFLHARPPRVRCPEHGVRQVTLPWADTKARFTLLFERFAIDVLRQTTIQAAREILGISWYEAWHLLDRAVERGLAGKLKRTISYYGVDEKSAGHGQDYITIICDLKEGNVEEVVEGSRKESLSGYLEKLSKEEIQGIEAISMDMSKAYIQAVLDEVPDGDKKIVFDRYHIMSHMGKAVDKVRREEHAALLGKNGESPLKGSKFVWLYSKENLPRKYWADFYYLKACDLKTGRAWAIKENLRKLWEYKSLPWAEKYWKKWYFWATHSRLEPVKKAAKTFKDHLYGILNHVHHPITNAAVEGLNSRIETIWKAACGFRNKKRFRTVILFHLGGLDLYPATH